MQAIFRNQYGSPDVLQLQTLPKPEPRADQLLVRVRASTVNRTDCGILRGRPFIIRFFTGLLRPTLATTGTDFAGIVEAVGPDVSGFRVGSRVFGFDDNGLSSHATYLLISEKKALAEIPANCSFEQAAASLEGAHYAYNFISKVDLGPNHRVLINGASGAIGSAALQLVKARGSMVTAVCNTKNTARIKALGADRVIDYEKTDFTRDAARYHFVFDAVGKSSFDRCKRLLLPGGVYISSELGWMAQNVFLALVTPLFGAKKVIFPIPVDIPRSLQVITNAIAVGAFDALIDRTYPLEAAADAFRYVESGQKTGNVVLVMPEAE